MLDRITITGADDHTSIPAMIDLSAEFPYLEWGILVSASSSGTSRFPSHPWIDRYCNCVPYASDMTTSMHVCGKWVRELLAGKLQWSMLPELRHIADRIQINTHAEPHTITCGALEFIRGVPHREFIIQLDGVSDLVLDAALARNITNVNGLFDGSHGAGILPERWPHPFHSDVYHGFAGGLSPDNVHDELTNISEFMGWMAFWIDMEGRVRDEQGNLDLSKVRRVAEICRPFVKGL